ncbi:arylsulfate sulfotransferase [Lampropedia cohaerens]|uniref:Arylsulfate sulfotransferase n=1 Tax=Lampropedia cohaerens TaxID=1610491 RepID=A0A0U1PZ62_9BURK|nr:ribbon-helix-helix domain-containing protein [Lampropedia cohaerens]KKW67767.1 arylsulfate sulfotransferase [Lampropedia cohaerens]
MCQIFVNADPQLYARRTRSIRLHGVVTSIDLENLFWEVLEEIARRDGLSVGQLCSRLYEELVAAQGGVGNFASFLRVCCGRYLRLQLLGALPSDPTVAIGTLDAAQVLAADAA